MPSSPDWKQLLEVGMQFTELRRSQAREIAAGLVAQGQLARDQLGAAVDEIVEMSRKRTETLRDMVAAEVQRQLGALGIATAADLERLERKLAKAPTKATKATKKAPAKAAKKTAKRPAAKRATSSATKKSTSRARG